MAPSRIRRAILRAAPDGSPGGRAPSAGVPASYPRFQPAEPETTGPRDRWRRKKYVAWRRRYCASVLATLVASGYAIANTMGVGDSRLMYIRSIRAMRPNNLTIAFLNGG